MIEEVQLRGNGSSPYVLQGSELHLFPFCASYLEVPLTICRIVQPIFSNIYHPHGENFFLCIWRLIALTDTNGNRKRSFTLTLCHSYCLLRGRRMASSAMLRRVVLVITDVSEELNASFIRVTRIGELGTTPSSPILLTRMKEALSSSETSVLTRATRRNIPEDDILYPCVSYM
jgi:hypothetical protein